ncbi:hypothetical protein KA107_01330 [Candidatus Pacearchaeota archaeon]|nr:hypothetical protein [Candidatus Pacearchaeota archaeon]
MTIKNPEKECKTTPEKFSAQSKIVSVENKEHSCGIIFDSPQEFGQALIVYGGGRVPHAGATQRNFLNAIGEDRGTYAVGLALYASLLGDQDAFTKRLVEEAVSSLESTGRFHESFDYTLNNFEKTVIHGDRVGDKYVLQLYASYVGSKPEEELAKKLGRPRALVSACTNGKLSVVDDWWFNVNLEEILADLPIPTESLAQYLASKEGDDPTTLIFKHEGQEYSIGVGLDAVTYLRPEGGNYTSNYMQKRGKFIVGGAWTTYADDGDTIIPPKAVQPSVIVSVSLPGERYSNHAAVTEEQMKSVRSVRDHLASFIQPK